MTNLDVYPFKSSQCPHLQLLHEATFTAKNTYVNTNYNRAWFHQF